MQNKGISKLDETILELVERFRKLKIPEFMKYGVIEVSRSTIKLHLRDLVMYGERGEKRSGGTY